MVPDEKDLDLLISAASVWPRVMRHKSWKSTQKHVHTLRFTEEDYEVTSATASEEILALGKPS